MRVFRLSWMNMSLSVLCACQVSAKTSRTRSHFPEGSLENSL